MMAKWYTELLMMGLQRTDAVYHATCMTNYLLKRIKDDSEEYLTSQNDILFQSFFSTIKDDLLTHKKIFTLTQLLELFFSEFLPFDPNFIEKVPYFTLTTCLIGMCTFCAFH
jgi:hypothetical protein